jgi:hypothetical protein
VDDPATDRYVGGMRRTLISLAIVLTSAFAVMATTAPAQADTVALYNEYTNPDLCMLVGQQGETWGQWIYYDCQMVYPESDVAGQWDLWVEYAG